MSDTALADQLNVMPKLTINHQNLLEVNKNSNVLNIKLPEKPEISELNDFSRQLELKVRKVRKSLEKWREIIVSLNSVLLWEKQWHAGAIFGTITSLFLFVWMFEPPVLTMVAVTGLIVTIGDYLIPTLANSLYRQEEWTGRKEKKFDYICRNLVIKHARFITFCSSFSLLRSTRPATYYTTTIGTLVLLGWLGSSIDNLLLTYLAVLFVLMLPGMENHGVLTKYTHCVFNKVRDVITKTKSKAQKTGKTCEICHERKASLGRISFQCIVSRMFCKVECIEPEKSIV